MKYNETEPEVQVSTEPQRIALERMSAELVHKLNVMIAEQEERARIFAEQHHSQSPLPQSPAPEVIADTKACLPPIPETEQPKPLVAKFKAIARNIPKPVTRTQQTAPAEPQAKPDRFPVRNTPPRKAAEDKEESSIGIGTIITCILIIIFLLRACS